MGETTQDIIRAEGDKGKPPPILRPSRHLASAVDFRKGVAKLRQKRERGLLLLWAFERLTSALGRAGLTTHFSIIYRENIEEAEPLTVRLSGGKAAFATAADLADIAAVEGYSIPLADLVKRVESGARCYLLRVNGEIAAFSWCELGGAVRPRLGLKLGATEAYLFDAHTAPASRGRNLMPFLRHRLYGELRSLGCTDLFSSTMAFNRPAHRFKQKLGARPLEARVYFRLFGRMEQVFVVWRFSSKK